MGVGKTTIGKWLAKQLQYSFLDTDIELQKQTGADIPWIFEIEGEDGFRSRETGILKQLSQRESVVVATGGGIVISEKNRQIMSDNGVVVYLHAPIELLLERTKFSKNRPLLEGVDRRAKFESLMRERDPLYRRTADLVVRTKRGSPKRMAAKLVKEISKYERTNS